MRVYKRAVLFLAGGDDILYVESDQPLGAREISIDDVIYNRDSAAHFCREIRPELRGPHLGLTAIAHSGVSDTFWGCSFKIKTFNPPLEFP